ncbi:MAG TPA: cyclic nucleotide-binding domain-containing protein [Verrucomicrobiota bacterium]|nr:cyclic nucleotide-binding domain-containing protein [Verrucomicrobiota bacterium]
MSDLELLVVNHPFWQGLRREFLPLVVESARLVRFGVGDLIFQERQEATRLYLVQLGQVALEVFLPGRGVTTLQILRPGDALGWSWMFPPSPWHYSARSVDAVETLEFDALYLRQRASENPAFGLALYTRMTRVLLQRLQATRLKLEEFHYFNASRPLDDCLGEVDEESDPDDYPSP